MSLDIWKRFHDKEVSHSMAHYLQAVASLKRQKGYARVGDIADRLSVSKSGVTSMLRSLQGRGLVDHERYGCVELTEAGWRLAERTESSRKVVSTFFTEILGVSEEIAEEDACMIEHLVSPKAMAQLLRLTMFLRSGHPTAVSFRQIFRERRDACEGHKPGECDLCGETCLRESFEREASFRQASGETHR
jgi:DtxR family Mn-dependent transcriptional regulator